MLCGQLNQLWLTGTRIYVRLLSPGNLNRGQLLCCDLDLDRERQERTMQEQHASIAVENGDMSVASNTWRVDGFRSTTPPRPFTTDFVKGADKKVPKEELSLKWTGPLMIIAVCLSLDADTSDGRLPVVP